MTVDDKRPDREEALKKILSDYEVKEAGKEKEKTRDAREKSKKELLAALLKIAAICFIAVIVWRTAAFALRETVFKEPKVWAAGQGWVTDRETGKCIANLWQVRKAIDRYYSVHREFPKGLAGLYGETSLKEGLTCPAGKREYVLKEINGEKVIACPNPGDHGVAEIYVRVKSGPPTIER